MWITMWITFRFGRGFKALDRGLGFEMLGVLSAKMTFFPPLYTGGRRKLSLFPLRNI
jgi:hypothetical protein